MKLTSGKTKFIKIYQYFGRKHNYNKYELLVESSDKAFCKAILKDTLKKDDYIRIIKDVVYKRVLVTYVTED